MQGGRRGKTNMKSDFKNPNDVTANDVLKETAKNCELRTAFQRACDYYSENLYRPMYGLELKREFSHLLSLEGKGYVLSELSDHDLVFPEGKRKIALAKKSREQRKQKQRSSAVAQQEQADPPPSGEYIDYHAYLNTEQWHRLKRQRILFDRLQCAMCGTAKNLQVHHITYERLGREELDDLITLCKECHAKVHENDLAKKGV